VIVAKILHISDWHVGASLYRCDRAPDHSAVLEETVAHAVAQRPDLILHTGDVFDALMPGHRALRQGVDVLQSLAEVAPVVVLAGNHDHPRLFEVFDLLAGASSRIRWVPTVRRPADGGIIDLPLESGERIRLAAVPFIHQNRFVDWFGDDGRVHATYNDKVRGINQILGEALTDGYDPTADVLIYAAHLHIGGAVLGGSERRVHVTEEYATTAESLPAVSYAALGHIHRPQALTATGTAAYAGSPLALDFGERGEAKSIVLADCPPGRGATLTHLPLSGGRPLRLLTGSVEEIEATATDVGEAIVKVVVSCVDPIDGLVDRVCGWMPDATIVEIVEDVASRRLDPAHLTESDREQTLDELFVEYLAEHGSRTVAAREVERLWTASQLAIHAEERRPELPGLEVLLTCELPTPQEVHDAAA
jgi:exonuclease SbcD